MTQATIDELTLADDPVRWSELGFDVTGDTCRLGTVLVRFEGEGQEPGIVGWSLRGIASTELDGLPTTRSHATVPQPAPVHPNGTVAIDHIVAMSPLFQRSVDSLQAAGLDLRRVREEPTPAGAPRQAFFRLGSEILELVQEPDEVVERAGGPDRPARFWGLALQVEDLERAAQAFGPHLGAIRPAVQAGRAIATLKRSAGLAAPLALMSTTPRQETA
jgi:hypothetical protein